MGVILYLLLSQVSWLFYLITGLVLTLLAIYISHNAEKIFNEKDPPYVVIDEIVGFQWTMFLVSPTVLHIFLGFFLFRFFDIVKVTPAGYFQKNMPGGFGMVLDDIVAGIYGNIVLLFLIKIWGI